MIHTTKIFLGLGAILSGALQALSDPFISQIPSIKDFTPTPSIDPFVINEGVKIFIDSRLPPTLSRVAEILRDDLRFVKKWNAYSAPIPVTTGTPQATDKPSIYFVSGSKGYKLYNTESTTEGYDFEITTDRFTIIAPNPQAAFWGTRTLLQSILLSPSSIPAGKGTDSPGWGVRGIMLDAGRHFFPASFLTRLCVFASFYKLNEFQVHASDNLRSSELAGEQGAWMGVKSGFRFRSTDADYSGLSKNGGWTQEEWKAMQQTCNERGIRVVPEIDVPGHALAITQWKPSLRTPDMADAIDLSSAKYSDAIGTVQGIWNQYYGWMTSDEVSIGADEYPIQGADADTQYIKFINDMYAFHAAKGKHMRVWGAGRQGTSINKDIIIQHWDDQTGGIHDGTNPQALFSNGRRVINSSSRFIYLGVRTGIPFPLYDPPVLDQGTIWGWAPNVFTDSITVSPEQVGLLGSIMPLWNDWGDRPSTQLEEYYQFAESIPVFAQKVWAGNGVRATDLTQAIYQNIYQTLNKYASGSLTGDPTVTTTTTDGQPLFTYDNIPATVSTSFKTVEPPYTLKFTINPTGADANGKIFSGEDTELLVDKLAFRDVWTNELFALSDSYVLPVGQPTAVVIHATREYTEATIGGQTMRWTVSFTGWGGGQVTKDTVFAAPSSTLRTSFGGSLTAVSLTIGIQP